MNNFKNILAIETSGLYCSVALRSGEEIKILKKECLINQEDLSNYVDVNSKETFYVGNGIRFLQNIEDKNTYENFFSQASNMFELIDLAIEQKSYVAAEEVSPNYLSGEDHWKKAN